MGTNITRVRAGISPPNVGDVLDYAIAMIEAYGWNGAVKDGTPSSETAGYSLHDSVGEACTRLSKAVDPRQAGRGSKDWSVRDADGIEANLRELATARINQAITDSGFVPDAEQASAGYSLDVAFNDKAADAAAVLSVLRSAREGVAA